MLVLATFSLSTAVGLVNQTFLQPYSDAISFKEGHTAKRNTISSKTEPFEDEKQETKFDPKETVEKQEETVEEQQETVEEQQETVEEQQETVEKQVETLTKMSKDTMELLIILQKGFEEEKSKALSERVDRANGTPRMVDIFKNDLDIFKNDLDKQINKLRDLHDRNVEKMMKSKLVVAAREKTEQINKQIRLWATSIKTNLGNAAGGTLAFLRRKAAFLGRKAEATLAFLRRTSGAIKKGTEKVRSFPEKVRSFPGKAKSFAAEQYNNVKSFAAEKYSTGMKRWQKILLEKKAKNMVKKLAGNITKMATLKQEKVKLISEAKKINDEGDEIGADVKQLKEQLNRGEEEEEEIYQLS